MQGVSEPDGAWLHRHVLPPSTATNTILITHLPSITRALPQYASGIADGERWCPAAMAKEERQWLG
jgi:hypothetical protein